MCLTFYATDNSAPHVATSIHDVSNKQAIKL